MLKRFIISAALFAAQSAYAESVVLEEIKVKSEKEARVESLEVSEVQESNAKDVCDAMQGMADVSQVRKGGIASDIVIRGYQKDNINVMIDGARLHGGCPNRMDPPTFHLDFAEVDRVEVLKGAYDVTNPGSVGGLVNIKTKSAQQGVHAELNGSAGSFASYAGSGYVSYGEEMFDVILGAAQKQSDAYQDGNGTKFTEIYSTTSMARYRTQDTNNRAYDVTSGWGKIGFNPTDGHRAEFSYTNQQADDVLYPYLMMDGITDVTNRYNLTYTMKGVSELFPEINLQVYNNTVEHDMNNIYRCSSSSNAMMCTDYLPLGYSMRSYAKSATYGVKADAMVNVFGGIKVGVDYYVRKWDLTTTMYNSGMGMYMDQSSIPNVYVKNAGLFAEYVNSLSNGLNYTVGLRYDATSQEALNDRTAVYDLYTPGSSTRRNDSSLSGNLQLTYGFTEEIEGFFGVGRTVRTPDPAELYYALSRSGTATSADWVGNPNLKTVKNTEFDLGVKGTFGTTLVKANVFYSDVQDYIELTNITGAGGRVGKGYKNINAVLYGGEVSMNAALPRDFFLSASAAYTIGRNETDKLNLLEIPPLKAVVGLRYDNGEYFAEGTEVMAATQNKVNTAMNEEKTAGWGITNLKAGYTYHDVKLIAGVDNVFDHYYTTYLSSQRDPFSTGVKVAEPGRSYFLNLQYRF